MTYTREDIEEDNFNPTEAVDVDFEEGAIYQDSSGQILEILDIKGDEVDVVDVYDDSQRYTLSALEVRYFCKHGYQNLSLDRERIYTTYEDWEIEALREMDPAFDSDYVAVEDDEDEGEYWIYRRDELPEDQSGED